MPNFNHVMVDIETTGLQSDRNAILQITAIRFDPVARDIDQNWFNRCLGMPNTRSWDEGTREWWASKPEVYRSIMARMENPAVVMADFWTFAAHQNLHFWSKPLSFDFPFIQSYFHEFGPAMPFPHWQGRDLRTFLAGLSFPEKPFDEKTVEFQGPAHDALFDTIHQIDILFKALEARDDPQFNTPVLEISE